MYVIMCIRVVRIMSRKPIIVIIIIQVCASAYLSDYTSQLSRLSIYVIVSIRVVKSTYHCDHYHSSLFLHDRIIRNQYCVLEASQHCQPSTNVFVPFCLCSHFKGIACPKANTRKKRKKVIIITFVHGLKRYTAYLLSQ